MMAKNRLMLLSLTLLLALSGCGKRKSNNDNNVRQELDIPMSDDSFCSLFDEDLEEFEPTEVEVGDVAYKDEDDFDLREFTWVEDTENPDGFRTVYFGFDRHNIAPDQEESLAYNIELAQARLAENSDSDYRPTIVVEGNSCHSAGQPWYNMLISERRAKRVADELVAAGIPEDCIKVVGRGSEVPALIDGEPVTGDRLDQAPNRRCEMRIIYA